MPAVVEWSARPAAGVQRRRAASDVARGGRGGPGRSLFGVPRTEGDFRGL